MVIYKNIVLSTTPLLVDYEAHDYYEMVSQSNLRM
jgi:hypothetical protein